MPDKFTHKSLQNYLWDSRDQSTHNRDPLNPVWKGRNRLLSQKVDLLISQVRFGHTLKKKLQE